MPTRTAVDVEPAVDGDRLVVLGDLVVLRHVGIEVVLARERRLLGHAQVDRLGEAQRVLDHALVEHRQRARQPEAHRAHVRVGLGAELVGAAAEQLRGRRQLAVHLEPDDRLVRDLRRTLTVTPTPPATRATRNITASPSAGASTCTPTGRPASPVPYGTLIAAWPARLVGIVHTSERYIASGSADFAPSSNATVGDVGDSSASYCSYARAKSRMMSVRTRCACP